MATEIQRKSKNQEMRITRSFRQIREDAKRMMASGAMWFAKSDIVTKLFRIEAKTKAKPSASMTLKKEWFDKIRREAFETGKIGILAFSFGDSEDYLAISSKDFLPLIEELIELREKVG
jgi:hypothetical protein